MKTRIRILSTFAALATAMVALAGCAGSAGAAASEPQLRLGYFANVTHAPALIGVSQGLFAHELGGTRFEGRVFSAGPTVIEALTAGAIDAAYVGPNPAINTFIQSAGASGRIIAGAATGGAALVVRDGIDSADDLDGAVLASPQLGNTQDVALRRWLADQGLRTTTTGQGEARVTPTANPQTLTLFRSGDVDGAWLPEPWASRLVIEAGAHVLVDERELWADGVFPTTVLLVREDYAHEHPELVDDLLRGHLAALRWIDTHPDELPAAVNESLTKINGAGLDEAVLSRALAQVEFTDDPHAETFRTLMADGIAVGTQKPGSIEGLFDLSALNRARAAVGDAPLDDAGLGVRR